MKQRHRVAKRKRHKGRYRFTKKDCQRGYQAALEKCMEDWQLYAWLYRLYVA
jgi:hypothetical protein